MRIWLLDLYNLVLSIPIGGRCDVLVVSIMLVGGSCQEENKNVLWCMPLAHQ